MSSTDVLAQGRRQLNDGKLTWRPMLFGGMKIHITMQKQKGKVIISDHRGGDILKLALWSCTVKTSCEQALSQILRGIAADGKRREQQQGGSDGQDQT